MKKPGIAITEFPSSKSAVETESKLPKRAVIEAYTSTDGCPIRTATETAKRRKGKKKEGSGRRVPVDCKVWEIGDERAVTYLPRLEQRFHEGGAYPRRQRHHLQLQRLPTASAQRSGEVTAASHQTVSVTKKSVLFHTEVCVCASMRLLAPAMFEDDSSVQLHTTLNNELGKKI